MKKWIIGIVIIVIIAVGGAYLYMNRSSSAVTSLNGFITSVNKYNLGEAENYTNQNGNLTKFFNQIQTYDGTKQGAIKQWFKAIKLNVNSVKKSDGEVVINTTIYSLNGSKIASDYQYNVNNLNITSQVIQDSNLNGNYLQSQLSEAFLNAVSGNVENIVGNNVEIKMKRTGGNWVIQNDNEVIQGLLGGVSSETIFS